MVLAIFSQKSFDKEFEEIIQNKFKNAQTTGKKVSFADLLVIGSAGAIEKSALASGFKISVPVKIGRVDAVQSQTDIESIKQFIEI